MEFHKLRKDYEQGILRRKDLLDSPFDQLRAWLELAIKDNVVEPFAMTLATANQEGRPSNRVVLLRHLDESGLVFFTNHNSRKAKEIAANPYGTVVFWWSSLEKQVIVEGRIEKVPDQEADVYFAGRPRGSQLGAWASDQDTVLENREQLEEAYKKVEQKYKDKDIPRPPFWGGYRLAPERFEFWQGRQGRLHDRFEYIKDNPWQIQRLSP